MDNPHRHASSDPERHQIHFEDETRTIQAPAESCEINNIMAKYEKTGLITHQREAGSYADLPEPIEYQEALNRVMEAQASFDLLPAQARKEFGNDPEKFLAFVDNPENVQRMGELGLLNEAPQPPAVDPLPVADPPAAAAEGNAT